ncbi:Type 1 glutamine amidotransferase-like domain-containing protein [Plantactinospora sp. KBS50]|uniref:Type 1 glutamine amidotransferase-like domain-containing protein n=1 Tax=Plantactinospora sp. KBS50 TaxID=2024580 RepID=UPI0035174466
MILPRWISFSAVKDSALGDAESVLVTGGYPIFLLQHARQTGCLAIVRQRATSGDLAYAGMSSGAALRHRILRPTAVTTAPGR